MLHHTAKKDIGGTRDQDSGSPSTLFLINCYDIWSATPLDGRDCDCVFPPSSGTKESDAEPQPQDAG